MVTEVVGLMVPVCCWGGWGFGAQVPQLDGEVRG